MMKLPSVSCRPFSKLTWNVFTSKHTFWRNSTGFVCDIRSLFLLTYFQNWQIMLHGQNLLSAKKVIHKVLQDFPSIF